MIEDPIPALRRQLADDICAIASRMNFHVAAWQLGIDTPRLTDIRKGRLDRFSIQGLIRMLALVGRRVELRVTPGPEARPPFPKVGPIPPWGRNSRSGRRRGGL